MAALKAACILLLVTSASLNEANETWCDGSLNDTQAFNSQCFLVKDGDTQDQPQTHRLAVLVPYRDREEELELFLPHMGAFLARQNISFHIFVLQQVDDNRFNRASLMNVGFLHIQSEDYDYIAIHDVDLLPIQDQISYEFPQAGPMHITRALISPRRSNVGGVLLMTSRQFLLVRGMSNLYWGYGPEDEELALRLRNASLTVRAPPGVTRQNGYKYFNHTHVEKKHTRDKRKCKDGRHGLPRRRDHTGLHDVSYTLRDVITSDFCCVPFTLLRIELHCNRSITPWCRCD